MPVIVPHAVDPAHLVSTHKTRPTLATVAMVATVAIPATLTREPEFFWSAWAALAPLLWDIGQDLIEHHGFQAAGEANEGILLDLVISKDESALRLRLPTLFADLPHFLPNAIQLITGNHAEIACLPPLHELLRWVQCFLPGLELPVNERSTLQAELHGEGHLERSGRYPGTKWLLGKEDILRDVFGCGYFRHLLAASQLGE